MGRDVEGVRPAVVGDPLRGRLHEYLRFRHLFRHGYGFTLEWAKLVPLLEGMQTVSPELAGQLDGFVAMVAGLADRLE